MARNITFNYEGTDYTLEFNRKAIEQMERQGFNILELADKPMTMIPALFGGAFLMHHKFVKPERVEEIYASLGDKAELIQELGEMYRDAMNTLFDEVETSKKVSWKMNR